MTSSRRSLGSLESSGMVVEFIPHHTPMYSYYCLCVRIFVLTLLLCCRPFPKQQRKEECLKALKNVDLEPGMWSDKSLSSPESPPC